MFKQVLKTVAITKSVLQFILIVCLLILMSSDLEPMIHSMLGML